MSAKNCLLAAAVALPLLLAPPPVALATGIETMVGDVSATLFAPGMVWRGTSAHVVVKLRNRGSRPVAVHGLFEFPKGKEGQFYAGIGMEPAPVGGLEQSVKDLEPGETGRFTFTYIRPKPSAPLGRYEANVILTVDGVQETLPLTLEIQEGRDAQPKTMTATAAGASAGMLLFWFVYFKGFVNKSFHLFGSNGG